MIKRGFGALALTAFAFLIIWGTWKSDKLVSESARKLMIRQAAAFEPVQEAPAAPITATSIPVAPISAPPTAPTPAPDQMLESGRRAPVLAYNRPIAPGRPALNAWPEASPSIPMILDGQSHATRSTSETISEHRRALMLPQELKLLPKSKAFILGTGIPPTIADKIIYYQDKAFLQRLLPAPVPDLPKGRSNALLGAEIKELRSEVAELRAVFRTRPMTDEEVADPSTIPANGSFDFGDVDVDLEGLSEDDMKAWTLNYIDAQAIPPARRSGRKQNGQQHERHA